MPMYSNYRHAYCTRTPLIATWQENLAAHTFARAIIVIDININQPQFSWVVAGHGEGHVISHRGTCIDWWFPRMRGNDG